MFNIEVAGVKSAGFANLIAAVFGISISFIGSRYFVFRMHQSPVANQLLAFLLLYASIACLHGLVLYGWTDLYGLDYRFGFVVATFLQVVFSYWGNKVVVFKS
jgi:putative flippase GtrA